MSVDPPGLHQKVTNHLPTPGPPDWSSAFSKSFNMSQKPSISIGGLHSSMASASNMSSAPSTLRKRTRSFTMDTIPQLPNISGDMMLEVFTHSSLRFPRGPSSEEYGDNERLSILGAKAVETAVTYTLFCKKPLLTAKQLQDELTEALSDVNVDHWLSVYRLREKIRCTPDVVSSLKSPEEGRLLFNSYVGAVFAQSGMTVVQDWISKLVEPVQPVQAPNPDNNLFAKRAKNEPTSIAIPPPSTFSPAYAMHQAHYNAHPPSYASHQMTSTPPPPSHPPPPLPNGAAPQNHPIAYLPLFNQTANQRRLGVEYSSQFFGPPHAGRWTVKCMVNGIEKGQGTGSSKQLAKEEAAKQAFYALGWAV